ncbi:MAG: hypothetical protein WCQ57_07350 [Verrucomicrobiota bacterium]
MSAKNKINIGIIGCGNISQTYFNGAKIFEVLNVVACADLNMEAAKAKAAENASRAQTVEQCWPTRKSIWSST